MQRAYLISILIATLVIAVRNAKDPKLHRGLKRTVTQTAVFVTLWGIGCAYLYWHLPK